jgi:D-alanyl-D-alanine carboxypeptidase (penicillin-binding protein 5/6)
MRRARHAVAVAAAMAALAAPLRTPAAPAEPARDGPRDRFPRAAPSYLVAVDGRLVWARRPDAPRPPASLAKLMAALVALDGEWAPDRWIAVSARAAGAGGARLGLRAGERLRARDALRAMLVASANDACLALAEATAGTAEAFVARMNARASALGLAATRFADPCGFDAPGQATTASDLWTLTRAALLVPALREAVALDRIELATAGGRRLAAATRNSLLGRARGVRGVKTGTTAAAGRCIVALAERDGREVLVVLLGAPDRWWTAAAIIEAAFEEVRAGG